MAQQYAVSQGLEMSKGDFGHYPSSVPQTVDGREGRADSADSEFVVQGSHRLAFALMGRDKFGCPREEVKGPDGRVHRPDGITGYYYTKASGEAKAGSFDSEPVQDTTKWGGEGQRTPRRNPYVNFEGLTVIEDRFVTGGTVSPSYVWLLCDKYDRRKGEPISGRSDYAVHSPILYYAADTTPGEGKSPYHVEDNARIAAGQKASWNAHAGGAAEGFQAFIEDASASDAGRRVPHNPDSFLLISAGADGVFGTEDDIVNWEQ